MLLTLHTPICRMQVTVATTAENKETGDVAILPIPGTVLFIQFLCLGYMYLVGSALR